MRKLGLTLLLTGLIALVMLGCSEDEPQVVITRLYASESCGVAPLRVDFRVDATGGKPLSEPTGSNNWLKLSWDFGDGTSLENATSVAYHRYETPGIFTVTVTAEDDRGERASRSLEVQVNADTLSFSAFCLVDDVPALECPSCARVRFGVNAETCGFDPVADAYDRFTFHWNISGKTFHNASPIHLFSPQEEGPAQVIVRLGDPGLSVFRYDTLNVTVLPSLGADLSLRADWLLSDPSSPTETLALAALPPAGSLPVRYTYTIWAHNDGPENAYDLNVTGTLPNITNYTVRTAVFEEGTISSGSLTYDSAAKRWTWFIPEMGPAETEFLHVRFRNEVRSPPTAWPATLSFPVVMSPYVCDPDTSDLRVTLRLTRP